METTAHTQTPNAIALDSVVSRIEAAERQRRVADAAQIALFAEALDQASPDHFLRVRGGTLVPDSGAAEMTYRSIRAELALAIHASEQTVERRLAHAYEVTQRYPQSYLLLAEGAISLAHTEVLVSAGRVLGEGADVATLARRSAFETAVLSHAVQETPARLRPIARRLAEQYAAQPIDERYAAACQQRRVWVVDREDGMSDLSAYLPAAEAHAIYDRLTRVSKELARIEAAEGESGGATGTQQTVRPRRTRDQLRSDVFSAILRSDIDDLRIEENGHATGLGGVRAHVQVFITDEVLWSERLQLDDEHLDLGAATALAPAELAGSGPIDTAAAKQLAATADHWDLVHLEPDTGAVMSVNRYRPSTQMKRFLSARDLHCRFPGCRAPVHRCDLDHTVDAAKGGATSTANLAHLCRGHHTLKHHGGWQVRHSQTNSAAGTLEWQSPTHRIYLDRPPSQVRFQTAHASSTSERLASHPAF